MLNIGFYTKRKLVNFLTTQIENQRVSIYMFKKYKIILHLTSYYLIENTFLDIKTYYEQFGYNEDIGKFPDVVFPTFIHNDEIYEDNIE